MADQSVDYLYLGSTVLDFEVPESLTLVYDKEAWKQEASKGRPGIPLVRSDELAGLATDTHLIIHHDLKETSLDYLVKYENAIVLLSLNDKENVQLVRKFWSLINSERVHAPVVLSSKLCDESENKALLFASSEIGAMLIDGFGDGVWLKSDAYGTQFITRLSFGILQATRTRVSKTEYISCPSCGRTLFDLQETTAKIKKRTEHLKGVKIGIMGCIVNGPGEMADADYGYVGSGPGKIHLYKGQTIVVKNISEEKAVEELIELIKSNGDWVENNINS
jgi:(E)-4-hydroxy-3-methylbut-2-enyl-diphosphate synthase